MMARRRGARWLLPLHGTLLSLSGSWRAVLLESNCNLKVQFVVRLAPIEGGIGVIGIQFEGGLRSQIVSHTDDIARVRLPTQEILKIPVVLVQRSPLDPCQRCNAAIEGIVGLDVPGGARMPGCIAVMRTVVEAVEFAHQLPITRGPVEEAAGDLHVRFGSQHTVGEVVDLFAEGVHSNPQTVERAAEKFIAESPAYGGMRVRVAFVLHIERAVENALAVTQI